MRTAPSRYWYWQKLGGSTLTALWPYPSRLMSDRSLSARVKTCGSTKNLGHQRKRHKETVRDKDHQIQQDKRDTPEPTLHDETKDDNRE